MNPNRSRSGPGSRPARVVAPTSVNGGISSGIAVAPGPLPIDDVDPEVLHRHVEHLLGRPGHPVDLVDEQHVALVQAGQDRGEVAGVWIAGPLVSRNGVVISAAMIIASVVLPSPGGPESSTWSGARPRWRAASSTRPSCSRTRCWPTTSSRVLGRSAASTARSSPSASAVVSDWRWASSTASRWSRVGRGQSRSRLAQGPQRGAEQGPDVGFSVAAVAASSAATARSPGRRPSPTSRARPGPGGPGSATASAAGSREPRPAAPVGAPSRSLSSRMIRCGALLADARDPGQRLDVVARDRRAQLVGA